ncbi:MFS transporter [uncultured Jatrophihabitans sp.]|uniref:MFS transporter n=1 Tax=uncultured Jatrophihabitans sp. TaxID=1610747 RepID=UPI0035CA462D
MPDLTHRRRLLILAICCMSLLIVGMDNTIVNVGLNTIRTDLHASLPDLQWTIDAYTVVLASLLMLSGSTADRIGRRRLFQIGLAVFSIGSLLCSIAPSLGWLIAFRAMQAVGGSMLNPVAMSIITNVFTDPKERARAIGVWGGVIGLSLGLGPVVGGALIDAVGWRSIFWINVPIGVAAFVLAALFVPESRAQRARRPDPIGQALVIVVLAGVTFGIIESPRAGWVSAQTITAFVLALAALVALLRYEPRRTDPLIDLRFFRSVPFSGATVIAVCAFGSFSGFLFLTTLYLQDVRRLEPLAAGLHLLPFAVVTIVFAPLSGRVVASRGPRLPLIAAGALMTIGALLLVPTSAHESTFALIATYTVFAMGFGIVNAPITNTAVSGMPRAQAGVAAAVASTSRQVGAALGVAVVGSVLASGVGAFGGSLSSGFVAASRTGWWILVGCGVAVLVLGAATTGRAGRRSAGRTADLIAAGDEPEPQIREHAVAG